MFSLLYGTFHQIQSSLFNPIARAIAITGRSYSASTTGSDWTLTHQYASRSNEREARRRATDPQYRERALAQMREWRKKNRVAIVDYGREWHKKNRAAAVDCRRTWRQQNPDKQEASKIRSKLSHDYEKLYYSQRRARWASDEHYKQRESLRDCVSRNLWIRGLTWRTHKPLFSDKTIHWCAGCKINRPLKLWWQDMKTDEFLCHPCFTSDWSRALPIGYEDKVFGRRQTEPSKTTTEGKLDAPPE
jgi:hypothetical protein